MHKQNLLDFWKDRFNFSQEVLESFSAIKREEFILEQAKEKAYQDCPLPILRGKTISQPSTVMVMTHALELQKGEKVFEVGAGSGYQAAIISQIVGDKGHVVSAEVVPELVHFSKHNLQRAGIDNVTVLEMDGAQGHAEKAPYDKIIITCACKEFPTELLSQLKPGGIIVGPVGSNHEQEMVRGRKDKNGKLELEFLGQFLFSPMYGKYGFAD